MIGRWRPHVHVIALARIPEDQWERLFDALADAAHDLDEQVTCGGHLNHWPSCPIGQFHVEGFRMRRRQAEALRARLAAVLRSFEPPPGETHIILRPRCRCSGDRADLASDRGGVVIRDLGGIIAALALIALVLWLAAGGGAS